MEVEDFKKSVAAVFPLWLFRVNNYLGVLPVCATRSGLKFSWLSAVKSVLAVILISYMLLHSNITSDPHVQIKRANKFSIRTLTSTINLLLMQVGSIVSLFLACVRCFLKNFDSIVANLVEFERFWWKKMSNKCIETEESVNTAGVALLLYDVGLLMPLMIFEWSVNEQTTIQTTGMYVYLHSCRMYLLLNLVIFLRIAKSLGREFMRLNSVVKYCLVDEGDTQGMYSVFTVTGANEGHFAFITVTYLIIS